MLKKILTSPWTALITLALILSIRIADPSFVESVRLRYFDTLITNKASTVNNVYTVNIDEDTISKYGQWPFKRDIYAEMIRELYARNAGLVVWNVLMPESDRQGGDAALAETLKKYPVVLANTPHTGKTKNTPKAPGSAVVNSEYMDSLWKVEFPGMIANVKPLENAAAGVGTTNTFPEIDGVNRRIPLFAKVDNKLYPGLALETMRVATGNDTFQIKLNPNGVEKMRLPGEVGIINTDNLGRVWVDWSQKSKSASMSKLPKDFGGAIVIVGTAAAGLGNPVPTSVGNVWPQDMQASVIGTMINKVNIQRPDWADDAESWALAVLGIVLLFLTRWTYVGLAGGVIALAVLYPISQYVYTNYFWLVDITALAGGLVLVLLHAYGVKFVSEFLQKQAIKKQFAGYCSP